MLKSISSKKEVLLVSSNRKPDYFLVMKTVVLSVIKKLNHIFNIVIGSFIGVFIGHGIYVYWDYKTHPDLYVMQSTPWYTSSLVYGVVTLILLVVLAIAKLIIRKSIKSKAAYHQ